MANTSNKLVSSGRETCKKEGIATRESTQWKQGFKNLRTDQPTEGQIGSCFCSLSDEKTAAGATVMCKQKQKGTCETIDTQTMSGSDRHRISDQQIDGYSLTDPESQAGKEDAVPADTC